METKPPPPPLKPPQKPPHQQQQTKPMNFDNLKAIKVLGKGAMGTVFLVHDVVSDPNAINPFALKVVEKSTLHTKFEADRRARWEINVIGQLKHPFLPHLITSFENSEFLSWALPFCPGGDLNVLRHRQNDRVFSASVLRFYLAEIICALEYLHDKGIVYRDLKPENVLVQHDGHITLTDFDLSRALVKKPHKQINAGIISDSVTARNQSFVSGRNSCDSHKTHNQRYISGSVAARIGFITGRNSCDSRDQRYISGSSTVRNQNFILGSTTDIEQDFGQKKVHHNQRRNLMRWFSAVNSGGDKKGLKKTKSARVSPVNRRKLSFNNGEKSNSFVGTEEYVSPEVVRGEGHEFAVDWWALGILSYEMLYGTTPFKGKNRKETFRNVLVKEPEFVGKRTELTDLIQRLLEKDPCKRFGYLRGASEIKEHVFFKGVKWDLLTVVMRPPFIPSRDEEELTEKVTAGHGIDIKEYFNKLRAPLSPTCSPTSDYHSKVSLAEF